MVKKIKTYKIGKHLLKTNIISEKPRNKYLAESLINANGVTHPSGTWNTVQ